MITKKPKQKRKTSRLTFSFVESEASKRDLIFEANLYGFKMPRVRQIKRERFPLLVIRNLKTSSFEGWYISDTLTFPNRTGKYLWHDGKKHGSALSTKYYKDGYWKSKAGAVRFAKLHSDNVTVDC